ncbi:MAG: phospholipase D-like domain-containing protein [Methylocella sp.]
MPRRPPPPDIHYAPVENLEQADVALIDRAEQNIDMAAYVLTDRSVMRALIRAARRGVKIRIYMDGGRIGEREPTPLFRKLVATPEIDVRFKRARSPYMHLKSYQIDGRWLRTGAANFSESGLRQQDNDLLIIESQAAAEVFKRRFEAIFAQGEILPLAAPEQNPLNAGKFTAHPHGRCPSGSYQPGSGPCRERPDGSPAGATARCQDSTYSHAKHPHSGGTCSHHGGVASYIGGGHS